MTHNQLARAYDDWHAMVGPEGDEPTPWYELIERWIGPHLVEARVLEIGCGRGGLSVRLAGHGAAHVIAADFSPTAVDMASRLFEEEGLANVTARVDDIMGIGSPDDAFDLVVSSETIEHVPDPARAVAELHRVLRPGGHLFLTTPNYMSIAGLHRAWLRSTGRTYTEVGQPLNNLTLLPLTLRWVREAGFSVDRVDGKGHYLPVPRRKQGLYRIPLGDRTERLLRWFALHSLIVARK